MKSATNRLKKVTQKLSDDELKKYDDYVMNMESNGYIRKVDDVDVNDYDGYLMPHRGLYQKEKLRCVFDAYAKDCNNVSLNDLMYQGENLLTQLVLILIQFCFNRFIAISDIKAAFLQIRVCEEDRKYLRFLWNGVIWEFLRLPFGVTASPFLLHKSIQFLFSMFANTFPVSVDILFISMYVDDLILSLHSRELLHKVVQETNDIFRSANMELKNWVFRDQSESLDEVTKILGIEWNVKSDQIIFSIKLDFEEGNITKRMLVSNISKIYDPLGALNCWSISLRILIQEAWKESKEWDVPLSEKLMSSTRKLTNESHSSEVILPRFCSQVTEESIVYIFCDASMQAYSAVVYLRNGDDVYVMCKARVAPIKKPQSIPRLELMFAILAVRLAKLLKKSPHFMKLKFVFGSDSKIVLFWINKEPGILKKFESNRVRELIEERMRLNGFMLLLTILPLTLLLGGLI